MFQPFEGTIIHAIDGDSIWVNRHNWGHVKVRVGGIDVPSNGEDAANAVAYIARAWQNKHVHVKPTANYLVHGEIPAIVTDMPGQTRNLGKELLDFGTRLSQFPIEQASTPSLSALKL